MKASVYVGHPQAQVPPLLFGSFLELMGTVINDGIWRSDGTGPRADVLGAMRALRPAVMRFPGGCLADTYHWRDGIGPLEQRPRHEETFWTHFDLLPFKPETTARIGAPETNAFGTDEFIAYCDDLGAIPSLTANFGSGTPDEAAEWVAYTKGRVKHWFIGNETWGPFEVGHRPPDDYGRDIKPFVDAMRAVDPSIILIGVGLLDENGGRRWNEPMLAEAADVLDMLSLHYYFPGPGFPSRPFRPDDHAQIATGSERFGQWLARACEQLPESLPLVIDEWGLWSDLDELVETNYRACDALYFAGMYNRMLERSDRIAMGMHSYPVNTLGAIQTRGDAMWVNSAYLVQLLYREHCGDVLYQSRIDSPAMTVPAFADPGPTVPPGVLAVGEKTQPFEAAVLDAVATNGAVFLVNRSLEPLTVAVDGVDATGVLRWIWSADPFDVNDETDSWRVRIAQRNVSTDAIELPPSTFGVLLT